MIMLDESDLGGNEYHLAETVVKKNGITFLHTHEFYEIFLVTKGNLTHVLNGREIPMSSDMLCLVMPEDAHQYKKDDGNPAHFVNLAFSRRVFRDVLELYAKYGAVDPSFFEVSRMTKLPAGLSQALLAKIAYLSSDSTNLFRISKHDVLIATLLDGLNCLENDVTDKPLVPQWLTNACELMQKPEHYVQGLPRFVKLSGKSQEHLTRCMKKHFNTTPSGYLNGVKLNAAALLLKTTSNSVLDILMECGFNNVSYFNQVFKAEYGITPTQFRHLNSEVINPSRGE